MKKLLLALVLLASFGAQAEEVYLLPAYDTAGEKMPKNEILYALFLDRPCKLSIANQKNLRHADFYNPAFRNRKPDVGCWGMKLEPTKSEAIAISENGNVTTLSLTELSRARVAKDGDYVIQGRAMTFEQYRANVKRYQDSFR